MTFLKYHKFSEMKDGQGLGPLPGKGEYTVVLAEEEGKTKFVVGAKLPTDAKERKTYPIGSGVLDYFPNALAAVAHVSYIGNQQHNPGQPLHWDRTKSTDEADALIRHFLQRGTIDSDGVRHSAKVAWRALALLQKEMEGEQQ